MTLPLNKRVAAVIGSPVSHSLSPTIHNAAFDALDLDWVYVALDVPSGEGRAAVEATRELRLAGLSVTMPLKEEVVPHLDDLSPDASALGAVNCVAWDGDRLVGHSTDGAGFLAALPGFDPAGERCAVVGAGGAGRAVALALGRAGASEVVVINRSADRRARAVALAGPAGREGEPPDVATAALVVNATSVGMGDTGELPVAPEHIRPGQVVVDLVYQPVETPLLRAARDRGAVPVDGVGMLVHQAALAFRLWTGCEAPLDVMNRAARG